MIQIPHSRPVFGQTFENAASAVIQSGFLAQGQETTLLEQTISDKLGQRHVLAVDSGTHALALAIRHFSGNKSGAKVGIPAYACASLLFAVKTANAIPIFMDCDSSLCLDRTLALEKAETLDVLILVHPFGMVEPLIAQKFDCPVIEDIAQSAGAKYQGIEVGTFGDISIGSLYATKPWGGAYGGFVTSENDDITQNIRAMCNPDLAPLNLAYVGHHQLSNLHAAVARVRLHNAAHELAQRSRLTEKYNALIDKTSATSIHSADNTQGNYFRYVISTSKPAEHIIQQFRALGINASKPIQQPLHHGQPSGSCPNADDAWEHYISLPMLTELSDIEFAHMKEGIQKCLHS